MTNSTQRTMPMTMGSSNGHHAGVNASTPLSTVNRPRGYIALAVALIVGFAVLGYWFYAQAGGKVSVLVAAQEIPAGHVITAADLTSEPVAGGITAVAADHLSEVVGHPASVEILPHTPVQLAMVSVGNPLPSGDVLVGVAEAPGQIPSSGLAPGDSVEVMQLPAKTAPASSVSSPVLATATVFDVRANPAVTGGTLLTLEVPKASSYAVTAASDAGSVALVQETSAGS
jgi:Flp pilus assembly protein CpaB